MITSYLVYDGLDKRIYDKKRLFHIFSFSFHVAGNVSLKVSNECCFIRTLSEDLQSIRKTQKLYRDSWLHDFVEFYNIIIICLV